MNSRAMVRCIHFPSLFHVSCGSDDMRAQTHTHTHKHSLILSISFARSRVFSPSARVPCPVFRDRQAGSSGPARLLSCHALRPMPMQDSHAMPCHAVPCFPMLSALPCRARDPTQAMDPTRPSLPFRPVILSPSVSSYHELGLPDFPPRTPKLSQGYFPTRRNIMPFNLIRPLDLRTMLLGSYMGSLSNSRMINCRD